MRMFAELDLLLSFKNFPENRIYRAFDIGIALGSTSGSLGDSIGVGDGVGNSSGANTVPLFVCNTPPESITSSTRKSSPLPATFFPSPAVDTR